MSTLAYPIKARNCEVCPARSTCDPRTRYWSIECYDTWYDFLDAKREADVRKTEELARKRKEARK